MWPKQPIFLKEVTLTVGPHYLIPAEKNLEVSVIIVVNMAFAHLKELEILKK